MFLILQFKKTELSASDFSTDGYKFTHRKGKISHWLERTGS